MKIIKVSRTFTKGIVISKAFLMEEIDWSPRNSIISGTVSGEIKRYKAAVQKVETELKILAKDNAVFQAHLSLITDPELTDEVLNKIQADKKNAELALWETISTYIEIFESIEDEYMRERKADIADIGKRIMLKLQNRENHSLECIKEPVVIIAKDLTPSDTAGMDLRYVAGFITEEGGVTSHVAIMAKTYGIPALTGAGPVIQLIKDNDCIAFDALTGEIAILPDESTLAYYKEKQKKYFIEEEQLKRNLLFPAITTDGHKVNVYANVGNLTDIRSALEYHAEGIGLFRTEFLYMQNSHFPTEEEQFEIYKEAAQMMEGKKIIIRTLDIGGDKELSYFSFDNEENPFLGYRAIRMCLDRQDIFRIQLRALLRASAYGNIQIMYPMIISLEELRSAESLLAKCKQELDTEGIFYNKEIITGIMIETPASVACADIFANKAGFFSIGTNDLTQYTLAIDRGNKKVAHMYDSFHPAVLRNIAHTINEAHLAGIKTGMCGEFASNPNAIRILLGMGLDEFSMSSGSLAQAKEIIRSTSYKDAKEYAERILSCSTTEEVYSLL